MTNEMQQLKDSLRAMPTVKQGQFDDLKISTPHVRVWLSRMTKEDGASENDAVTVEHLVNGSWVTVDAK
jgi:hypothetical protein